MKMRFILIAALTALPFGREARAFTCADGTVMPIPDCCKEHKAAADGVAQGLGTACGGGVNNDAVTQAVKALSQGAGSAAQAAGGLGSSAGSMPDLSGLTGGTSPSAADAGGSITSSPQKPATAAMQWCPETGSWATSCSGSNSQVQQPAAATGLAPSAAPAGTAAPAAPVSISTQPPVSKAPSAQASADSKAQASGQEPARTFSKRPPIRVIKSKAP
ncbi:MAG: hypothetical protein NTX64_11610 [Elusimicrobia bacterium]|nr:hypothetical protein [Elusimicrobiota bacterium]